MAIKLTSGQLASWNSGRGFLPPGTLVGGTAVGGTADGGDAGLRITTTMIATTRATTTAIAPAAMRPRMRWRLRRFCVLVFGPCLPASRVSRRRCGCSRP